MSGTRCFVAIELTDDVRERLREARSALLEQAPAWRGEKWVGEHNLHITLKFLGSLDEDQLAEVRSAVGHALAGTISFQMRLAGLRAVPRPRRCSMVWAQFADTESACADLAATVERAVLTCGIAAEERPFTPHVTLARARRPRRLPDEALTSADAVITTLPISMSVLSATLFGSTLTRTGPVYEAIYSWAFSAAG
ncbi:MAG TPA: RNA 2',3'-cyclic phosphodiesterase [Coriobacteriia bacterium]